MSEPRRRYAPNSDSQFDDEESLLSPGETKKEDSRNGKRRDNKEDLESDYSLIILLTILMGFVFVAFLAYWMIFADESGGHPLTAAPPCDTISDGYQCATPLSHNWGQYSLYYAVPSDITSRTPSGCTVTFAQLLSRHGARSPTKYKTNAYSKTLASIASNAQNFSGPYAFLQHYDYTLGADDLTPIGEQQMVNSGIDFFHRYESLSSTNTPFIRAGDQKRVVDSAEKWSAGFHKAKLRSGRDKDADFPYPILAISEDDASNNTLNHGLCTAFETTTTGQAIMMAFAGIFLPPIIARLKSDLQISDLSDLDTLSLMDMCPFTVAADSNAFSSVSPSTNPFCALFSQTEWEQYDYFQSLGKYYRFGPGAPLGPTQGVGFVNELIARLISQPVQDTTSVNHTLDDDESTFPLGQKIYADFSHDNDMTAILSALGVLDGVPQLSKMKVMSSEEMDGYAASKTVPFGGRMVVEKLSCDGQAEEKVRVLVNGRVWPPKGCEADKRGMCTLGKFVEGLKFVREGGRWDECFMVERPSTPVNHGA